MLVLRREMSCEARDGKDEAKATYEGERAAGVSRQASRIAARWGGQARCGACRRTGDEIGGTGAGRGDAASDLAGGLAIALRGEDLALLVAAEDVADLVRASEGLVDLQGGTSGVGEDGGDALTLQALDDDISALAGLVAKARLPALRDAPLREGVGALRGAGEGVRWMRGCQGCTRRLVVCEGRVGVPNEGPGGWRPGKREIIF